MTDRRRILIVVAKLPFPTMGGNDLRSWQLLNGLAAIGEVTAFELRPERDVPPARPDLVTWRSASRDGADGAGTGAHGLAWLRETDGHPTDHHFDPVVEQEIVSLVDEIRPDLIVLGSLWLHPYLPALRRGGAPVVLDAPNAEGAIAADLAARKVGMDPREQLVRRQFADRTARLESRVVAAVDAVWAASEADADALRALAPDTRVDVIPNAVAVDRAAADTPAVRSRSWPALVFPATFGYPPNADAAGELIELIAPAVWHDEPAAELWLVGPDPTPTMRAAARDDDRIRVTGGVPDVHPWLASPDAVLAVPLRTGRGTRLKILEAWAAGTPVVTTAKGIEGLEGADGRHVLVAEQPDDFAAAVRHLADPVVRYELTDAARRLVDDRYSWTAAQPALERAVAGLLTP